MSAGDSAPTTIDEYITGFPESVRVRLTAVRETVREAAPDIEESISYRMPTFRRSGLILHMSAHKHHIGLYPAPSGSESFNQRLAAFRAAKSTVRLPFNQPLPLDLIREIVELRIAESEAG